MRNKLTINIPIYNIINREPGVYNPCLGNYHADFLVDFVCMEKIEKRDNLQKQTIRTIDKRQHQGMTTTIIGPLPAQNA